VGGSKLFKLRHSGVELTAKNEIRLKTTLHSGLSLEILHYYAMRDQDYALRDPATSILCPPVIGWSPKLSTFKIKNGLFVLFSPKIINLQPYN
jgi:hypothetical protein